MGRIRNKPTPEGRELGAELVRMTEPEIERLAENGFPDERCSSCAFRAGTEPNGCPGTVMDAMKCTVEDVPFLCHDKRREGELCHGFVAARSALAGKPAGQCPWPWIQESHVCGTDEVEDGSG